MIRNISKYIANRRKIFLRLGLLQFLLLALTLATPYLYKLLIDEVMIEGQLFLLSVVIIGYLVSYGLETILLTISTSTRNRMSNLLTLRIRKMLWRNYSRWYNQKFNAMQTGELKNQIDNDVEIVSLFPEKHIIQYYYHMLLLVFLSGLMLWINWKLALIGFISIPLSFWMTRWLGKTVYRTSEEHRNLYSSYEEWLKETLQEWKEVKSFRLERRKEISFTFYWKRLSRLFFKKQLFWTANRTFISVKDFFVTKLNIYFIGGIFIISGELTIGALVLFMSYYDQAFRSLGQINELDVLLQEHKPNISRVLKALDMGQVEPKPLTDIRHFNGTIRFHHIQFSYGTKPVLKQINFHVNPGECLAIIGASGSGKSTIAKLLLGVLQPQEGIVLLNDTLKVQEINEDQLNRKIGIIMQDSMLFNLSIRDNLLLANPKATEDDIWKACGFAQIDRWIESLPEGLDTVIGERGSSLSGGERQRLAVARIVLQRPRIVVFDEATSQMDHESELRLLQGIRDYMSDMTFIIITHRLQSVLISDRTILLHQGEVAAEGKHQNLMETSPLYRNMFFQQKMV
ncbi:ABC transporter ATP-binding protein [Paenibacillus herberti]|uniref:ABC transporter ATP-binding protein n=1 Tax=Paenibacillus herberti TaxID=1619309 RepID=UPI001595241F|nr:ABC transporter ATP-binding protein [Paenibacillus herberti]